MQSIRSLISSSSLLVLLMLFGLTIASVAQDRWERVGGIVKSNDGDYTYYVDTETISRPDSNTVIFWTKNVYDSGKVDQTRFKMWKNERQMQVLGDYGITGPILNIVPESVGERLYRRLFQ